MLFLLLFVWTFLLIWASVAEYKYYQAVKLHEPQIWEQLATVNWLKLPMMFLSPKGKALIDTIEDEHIILLGKKHRRAGIVFLTYVVLVIVISIIYFKLA